MSEFVLAALIGTILGIITGFLPGIHINTVTALFLESPQDLGAFTVIVVVSMSIANQISSFIPNTFLGVPSENNFLSILPAHSFTKKGLGLTAIHLTTIGSSLGLLIGILLIPFVGPFLENTHLFFESIIPFALTIVLALMVLRENTVEKKTMAFVSIFLSGICGLTLLNNSLFKNNLFVLVTGFFAVPMLVFSFMEKNVFPEQKNTTKKTNFLGLLKTSFLGTVSAFFSIIFPALGPNETIFLSGEFCGKVSKTKYLVLNGAVATASFLFSFIALFFIGNARTGAAVFVKQTAELSMETFLLIIFASLASCGITALFVPFLAKKTAVHAGKINHGVLNKTILVFLAILVFFLSGFFGLFGLLTASAIGMLANHEKIRRTTCMACLIVPTILFYLRIS